MTIASGLLKQTIYKKQSVLGTPEAGAGGQIVRRVTSISKADRDMFESNEIVSHHQSTGSSYGLQKADTKINGLLSAATYSEFIESILERDFATVTPLNVGVDCTAQAANPQFVDASAGYLAGGLKVGMVGQWTGWAGGSATDNNDKDFLILVLTAGNMTGVFLDGTAVEADAASDDVTFTPTGMRTYAPDTGHTKDYYTIEEFYTDITKSAVFGSERVSSININLPATGNATIETNFVGLSRSLTGAQVLTSPSAETTTAIMSAINGSIYIGVQGAEAAQTIATGLQFTISNNAANSGAVIGSNTGGDVTTGRIKISGSFTGLFDSSTLQDFYAAETNLSIILAITGDNTATPDHMTFTLPRIKLTGDTPDDGEKAIMRTYPFTAEIYMDGGAALAYDKTILAVCDSAMT